jgi:hypothetical protein
MQSPVDKLPVAGAKECLKLETVDSPLQEMDAAEDLDNEYRQFADTGHNTNFVLLICQLV